MRSALLGYGSCLVEELESRLTAPRSFTSDDRPTLSLMVRHDPGLEEPRRVGDDSGRLYHIVCELGHSVMHGPTVFFVQLPIVALRRLNHGQPRVMGNVHRLNFHTCPGHSEDQTI